jgi:hypothetical protein
MAFGDFRYPDVIAQFGLTYNAVDDLFAEVQPLPPLPATRGVLAITARLATTLNNEKARSEWLIAPLLADFWGRFHGQLGLYSGMDFQADPDAGLTGFLDFAFCRGPQQIVLTPPLLVVFEAKKENINEGLGQCVAALVGGQRFNQRSGIIEPHLYGCVTTGTAWRFMRLSETTLTVGLTEYTFDQLDQLLGILAFIMGPPPVAAAA